MTNKNSNIEKNVVDQETVFSEIGRLYMETVLLKKAVDKLTSINEELKNKGGK